MLPATCDGDRERTQKKPAVNNSGPWSRQAGEGENAPAAPDTGGKRAQIQNATAHGHQEDVCALHVGMLWSQPAVNPSVRLFCTIVTRPFSHNHS